MILFRGPNNCSPPPPPHFILSPHVMVYIHILRSQTPITTDPSGPDKWPRLSSAGARASVALLDAAWLRDLVASVELLIVSAHVRDMSSKVRLESMRSEPHWRTGSGSSTCAPRRQMGPTAHMRQVSTRTPMISSPAHATVCLFSPLLPRANASLRDRTSRVMLFCTCVPLAANILFRLELSVKWRLAVSHTVRPFVRDLYEWIGATMAGAHSPLVRQRSIPGWTK